MSPLTLPAIDKANHVPNKSTAPCHIHVLLLDALRQRDAEELEHRRDRQEHHRVVREIPSGADPVVGGSANAAEKQGRSRIAPLLPIWVELVWILVDVLVMEHCPEYWRCPEKFVSTELPTYW